jgi:hypothetical protein
MYLHVDEPWGVGEGVVFAILRWLLIHRGCLGSIAVGLLVVEKRKFDKAVIADNPNKAKTYKN